MSREPIDVGAVEDFEDGVFKVVEAGGRQVGVVRVGDRWHALRNICPHQSAPLCAGQVLPAIKHDGVGRLASDDGAPVVTCPWHGWEFSVDTGQSAWDPKYKVRAFAVTIVDGRLMLNLGVRR